MKSENLGSSWGRVAVFRGAHLVPLLGAPREQVAVLQQPWKDVVLERHVVHPGEIPEHEHPNLCLHLQITGERDFEWWQSGKNAVEHTVPGSLIVIPPGTRDRLLWRGSSERFILSIENAALDRLASKLGTKHPVEIRGAWSTLDPSMRFLVSEMGREAHESWPLGALYADLLALALQSDLIKNYSTRKVALPRFKGGLSLRNLKVAMEYMSENLTEDIGLEQIAGEIGLSASHFAHEFRSSTGATPYQYLLRQRLERAKDLLKTTKFPIQNIGALAGFKYPANFVRTFRQRVGQSPDSWRKDRNR
jgi:AraC family transcriptional regulator